jgi:hypothetical protein
MSKLVCRLETKLYQRVMIGHVVAHNLLYINYEELQAYGNPGK